MDKTIKVRENRKKNGQYNKSQRKQKEEWIIQYRLEETERRMDNTIKVRENRRKNGQYNKSQRKQKEEWTIQ